MESIVRYIKLPKWKAYLYSLQVRYKLYKTINKWRLNNVLGMASGEERIVGKFLRRIGKGELCRENRATKLYYFVKLMEQNQARANEQEFNLAVKISNIKKLKLEDLIMELKELRGFGKEVGLGISDMKNMDEDELVHEIIKRVEPKGKYSDEFVAWYSDLDESIFEEDDDEEDNESSDFDSDEVIEAIEDADSYKELKKIIEEYPDVFPEKLLKTKDVENLQEKMLSAVEAYTESEDDEDEEVEEKPKKKFEKKKDKKESKKDDKKKSKKKDEDDDEDNDDLTEDDINDLAEEIQECEDLDELKDYIKKYSVFDEVSTRGRIKVETLKTKMLEALGVEVEEDDDDEEEEKPVKRGRGRPPKAKKEIEDDEEEIELNQSLVKSMVKNKDLDGLQEAAKTLNIKLSSLEKRSPKRIGEKLIEVLGEEKPKKKEKDEKESKFKKKDKKEKVVEKTPFQIIEEMVLEEESTSSIIKAVTDYFEEKGKEKSWIKERVKQLIEVVKVQHDLE